MSSEVAFSNLTILETRRETSELQHLRIASPPDFQAAYRVPGQYVQIKIEELKPGFYAIANGPGAAHLELLIKRGSPVSDAILAKTAGGSLQVSTPLGNGYPLAHGQGKDVFVIGVGSGIAPLRALMQTLLTERANYGRIHFIYGARTPGSFPYTVEVEAWQALGVEVTRVCSHPEHDAWPGHVGRVQSVLLSVDAPAAPGSVAYVCGMKGMVEDVKAALEKRGVPAGRVYQNF